VNRNQLEHLIRAAAGNADVREFVVIGSQSILGAFPNAPEDLCQRRFENYVFQKPVGAFIPPGPGRCQSESRSGLLGVEHSRHPFEEGRSAGAQSGRKRPQEHGKIADFKPAAFRGFRNDAEKGLNAYSGMRQ